MPEQVLPKPWFGLRPPNNSLVAWGARAILEPGYGFSLVGDRLQYHGEDMDRIDRMRDWIYNKAIPALKGMMRAGDPVLNDESSNSLVVFESEGWRIMASPSGSYGYLFLVVFPYFPEKEVNERTI